MTQNQKGWSHYPQTAAITYAHDLAGNLTFLNRAAEQVSGYSCEEARTMNLAQLVAPELAANVCEHIADRVRDVSGTVYEVDIITKDGRRVALEVSTEVVIRNGQPVEIRGIAVPSVLRTAAPHGSRLRCLDDRFSYGGVAVATASGRYIEMF